MWIKSTVLQNWKPYAANTHTQFLTHTLLLAHIHILHISESVYDLLPKELQLPLASQDSHSMSQKSGGEAGPLPSAAVASGRLLSVLLFLLPSYLFCCPEKVTHPVFSLLINLDHLFISLLPSAHFCQSF